MHVPRDLLDQKSDALKLVLPGLLADLLPEHRVATFDKLAQDLLDQCEVEDREYAIARLASIRRHVGLPDPDGASSSI